MLKPLRDKNEGMRLGRRVEDACDHEHEHDLVQQVVEGKISYGLSWRVNVMI